MLLLQELSETNEPIIPNHSFGRIMMNEHDDSSYYIIENVLFFIESFIKDNWIYGHIFKVDFIKKMLCRFSSV